MKVTAFYNKSFYEFTPPLGKLGFPLFKVNLNQLSLELIFIHLLLFLNMFTEFYSRDKIMHCVVVGLHTPPLAALFFF